MSIFDKAKEKAEELVEKVKDKLDNADETGSETDQTDMGRSTIPSDGAVTPADVAESVADPELPHPGPTAD